MTTPPSSSTSQCAILPSSPVILTFSVKPNARVMKSSAASASL